MVSKILEWYHSKVPEDQRKPSKSAKVEEKKVEKAPKVPEEPNALAITKDMI